MLDQTRADILFRFQQTRRLSEQLCQPLETEDYVVQPTEDVSPPKWHLAHTSWFFETFLLSQFSSSYTLYNPQFSYLFNSYYNSVGTRVSKQKRGNLSRPTVKEIFQYRVEITNRVCDLIEDADEPTWSACSTILELGIQHEQQHQELLVCDIKLILAQNPSRPVYSTNVQKSGISLPNKMIEIAGGKHCIGYNGKGFCFDNELPHHAVWINDFRIQSRLVTNQEYLEFIDDGGYKDFRHWLSEGWEFLQRENVQSPLYWESLDGVWFEQTLSGLIPINPNAPVCHISFFEAQAFASWIGKRLPTEIEWEIATKVSDEQPHQLNVGSFLESSYFHPQPIDYPVSGLLQLFGVLWQWTNSAYLPYPNFKMVGSGIGEYNGKFMINQMVLRGGSVATPCSHIRSTYRNFFHTNKRWQFSGLRLSDNL